MDVTCECCWVVHGWKHYCTCRGGPTRTDKTNPLGLCEPWINTTMGRNEKDSNQPRPEMMSSQKPETCEHWNVTSTFKLGPHCWDCKEPLVGIFTPVSRRTPYGALLYAMKYPVKENHGAKP